RGHREDPPAAPVREDRQRPPGRPGQARRRLRQRAGGLSVAARRRTTASTHRWTRIRRIPCILATCGPMAIDGCAAASGRPAVAFRQACKRPDRPAACPPMRLAADMIVHSLGVSFRCEGRRSCLQPCGDSGADGGAEDQGEDHEAVACENVAPFGAHVTSLADARVYRPTESGVRWRGVRCSTRPKWLSSRSVPPRFRYFRLLAIALVRIVASTWHRSWCPV